MCQRLVDTSNGGRSDDVQEEGQEEQEEVNKVVGDDRLHGRSSPTM
jgi:hypothetical protein